jgi:hypothetical protein
MRQRSRQIGTDEANSRAGVDELSRLPFGDRPAADDEDVTAL